MRRCVGLVSGRQRESAWSPVVVSPQCHPPAPRPFIKDQIQASSLSNLNAMSTPQGGSPASPSFACQTKSGRGTGLMVDGGAAWRRCRLVSFFSQE